MGLLDRLKAAQMAREGGAEPAIDLTEPAADANAEAPAPAPAEKKPIWGRPSRCPQCHSPGYLDRIDLVNRVMYQHCPECQHRWDTPESETIRATV